jgi:hypothetical protein
MTDAPQLIGGPSDGTLLPARYADAPVIQVPVTDGQGNFATYAKDLEDPSRFLFQGFAQ